MSHDEIWRETHDTDTEYALSALKDQIEYLIDRAKYHGEGEHPPQDFIDLMQDLLARTNHILRSMQ